MNPLTSTRIIQNAVYIPEDDIYLISTHVHDYVSHKCKDGNEYSVDGGNEYFRHGFSSYGFLDSGRVKSWSLTSDSGESHIFDKLLWGTRGKDGKSPLAYRPIKTFDVEHLKAILDTQPKMGKLHRKVVEFWYYQKLNPRMVKNTEYKLHE